MKCFRSFIPALVFLAALTSLSAQESFPDSDFREYELQRLRDPATGIIPPNIRQKELEYAVTLPGYNLHSLKGVQLDSANAGIWQARGPWNVGGRTRAFAIDVSNSNKFLVGSASGGMWTSVNGGTSWTPTWNVVNQSVSCVAQDTRTGKTNTWYVGTGEGYAQSATAPGAYYLGNGMYKSTDGGQTWNSLDSTASNTPQLFDNVWDVIWNVATNPADTINDVVYAATYGAIMKSTNGGTSWKTIKGNAAPSSFFTDVAVTPSGVVYATLSSDGSQKGIWRSADGNIWTNITPANFDTTYGRVKIGISPSDENQVYFFAGVTTGMGTPDTNYLGNVEWNSLWKYHYDTLGGKWYDLSANLPTTGGPFDKQHVQGGYDMVVKVHPTDTAMVFLGGTNLYRSTSGFFTPDSTTYIGGYEKGGTLPIVKNYLNHHPDQHDIVFMPADPKTMISANDGGIFKTTNNSASTIVWTPLNNGYLSSMFYTVAIDHAITSANDSTIIGGTQDNGSWFVNSKDPAKAWVQPRGDDGSYCAIAHNKLNYYFSVQNGKTMKTTLDSAGTVKTFARIDPIGGKGYQFINPFILDPNNNNVMYMAGGKNLWRNDSLNSIPMIGNWDSISTGWTKFPDTVPTSGATITALAVSNNPANVLYYGTSSKNIYRVDNSNTGTPASVDITGSIFPANANISCIAIDPADARKVMVAFSNYSVYSIFYSANADQAVPSWTRAAGNLEQYPYSLGYGNGPSVRWVSIMPVSNGNIYLAATSTGIYETDTLTGTTTKWVQQASATIGNAVCDMIDFRTSDGLVAVATHSRGIYTTNITSKTNTTSTNELQTESCKWQVYPNPNNGIFNVQMSRFENSKMNSIEVYNVMGECIHQQITSSVNFQINLSEAKSGIYYCVLKSDEAVETKKMVVIK